MDNFKSKFTGEQIEQTLDTLTSGQPGEVLTNDESGLKWSNQTVDEQKLTEELEKKADSFTVGSGLEMTPEKVLNVKLDTKIVRIVTELPEKPAEGDENKIHLVPIQNTTQQAQTVASVKVVNLYDEYLWNEESSEWELLGQTQFEIDLDDYLKITDYEPDKLRLYAIPKHVFLESEDEFEALQDKDEDTLYLIKDDETIVFASTDYVNAIKKTLEEQIQKKANADQLPKEWIGTEYEYEQLGNYDKDTIYYIKEDTAATTLENRDMTEINVGTIPGTLENKNPEENLVPTPGTVEFSKIEEVPTDSIEEDSNEVNTL